MTEVDSNRAIFSRFHTLWPAASSNVPYATENTPLKEPAATTFARIQVERLDGIQYSLGPKGVGKIERLGWIDVLLVGPMNLGSEPLLVLAQVVRSLYERVRFGTDPVDGVQTFVTSARAVRNHPEYPGCAVVVARTPFQYFDRS